MMRNVFKILLPVMALGAGAGFYFLKTPPMAPTEKALPELRPRVAKEKAPVSDGKVQAEEELRRPPGKKPAQKQAAPPVQAEAPRTPSPSKAPPAGKRVPARHPWWEQQLRQFEQFRDLLNRETDPARRRSLIRRLGAYVRVDTLRAMEWAMGLMDPGERRAALEAINQHALVGIGARIEVDHTGFPKIRDTTVLSAVAATGQVQPGDYIVGIEDEDGKVLSFKDLPSREIVQHLRGEAGSEVRLLMERAPSAGASSQPFEVVVQRSLLVIQPPH